MKMILKTHSLGPKNLEEQKIIPLQKDFKHKV
jgi:hypothetical protein